MATFNDRARAEAERREYTDTLRLRSARLLFCEGVEWAVEQEPTDEEVDAADAAFHEVIMSGEWVTQKQAIRAALIAAREARKA